MTATSLDSIVRTALMKKGYPLHQYVQFLVYARECLQELTMDDLKIFNTKLCAVDEFNAIELPNDYQDYVMVGVMSNQGIRPLVESRRLNVLNNYNTDLEQVQWTSDNQTDTQNQSLLYYGAFPYSQWYTVRYNAYGENLGRSYGSRSGYADTFVVIKERNQIQLNEKMGGFDYIYLQYMSDGSDSGSATMIDPYAQMTIQTYCNWMHKENNRTYNEGERARAKQEYIQQRQIMRARKSDLTLPALKRIIQRTSIASPKN